MRIKRNISIFVAGLLLMGCSHPEFIKSVYVKDKAAKYPSVGHDSKGKLQWAIANDSKNLYFRFETADRSLQPMILGNGFIIYLDTTGHKKKSVYFEVKNRPDDKDKKPFMANQKGEPGQKFMKRNFSGNFKDGYWKNVGDEEYFDLQFDNTYFAATFQVDSFGTLVCTATIPMSFIKKAGLSALNNMSVGLRVEPAKKPSMKNGNRPDGGEGMDEGGMGMGGGMPGGGAPGGMPGGGMPGGHRGGSMPGEESRSANPVEIWFLTQLAK